MNKIKTNILQSKELRRSAISQLVYVLLNIFLAVVSLLVVVLFNAPWLAVLLVVVSKWRIFAVKPRFWWANIQSNIVDFTVGLSFVAWLSQIGYLPVQIAWTILYIGWLLFIKPRSSMTMIAVQSLISIYLGISSIFLIGYGLDSSLVVGLGFIVMFSAARHLLSEYEIVDELLYAGFWGLLGAELAWVFHHWVITYPIPILGGFRLVQPAIILTMLSFLGWRILDLGRRQREAKVKVKSSDYWREIIPAVVFSAAVILVLLIFFSKPLMSSV